MRGVARGEVSVPELINNGAQYALEQPIGCVTETFMIAEAPPTTLAPGFRV